MSSINNNHQIRHHGTSQSEREIKALDPASDMIDDREIQYLLRYLWDYAAELNYYSGDEVDPAKAEFADGNWRDFLAVEPAFKLAVIATEPIDKKESKLEKLKLELESNQDNKVREQCFEKIFRELFGYATEVDQWINSLHGHADLQKILRRMVKDRLTPLIKNLIKKYGDALGPLSSARIDYLNQLKDRLHLKIEDEAEVKEPQGLQSKETEKGVFNLQQLLTAFRSNFQNQALELMHQELKKDGSHKPHITLLLAFLSLFQESRDQLNKITARHLDYCFRQVLMLENGKEKPDQTYLLFEVDDQKEQAVIPAETQFNAGQDANGKDLLYRLPDRFIANHAKVADLKHVYLNSTNKGIRIHTAETSLKDGTPFLPFGSTDNKESEVGFALSSAIFRLSGGEREITMTLTLEAKEDKSSAKVQDFADGISFQFSGAKNWITPQAEVEVEEEGEDSKLQVKLNLSKEDGPIVNYEATVLKGGFETPYPVLRCLIASSVLTSFNRFVVSKCDLKVAVTGASNYLLQSENALVEPEEPFTPFGESPDLGSALLIGSRELFEKKIDSLTINWSWCGFPRDYKEYYSSYLPAGQAAPVFKIKCYTGKNGRWHNLSGAEGQQLPLPADNSTTVSLRLDEVSQDYRQLKEFSEYAAELREGFVKLELCAPDFAFGHNVFPEVFQKHELEKATQKTNLLIAAQDLKQEEEKKEKRSYPVKVLHFIFDSISQRFRQQRLKKEVINLERKCAQLEDVVINPPYTPMFCDFSLDYQSSLSVDFLDNQNKLPFSFAHLYPFGSHVFSFGVGSNIGLYPYYQVEGSLYIGLENVQPGQTISLLFSSAPESGDPFAPEPAHIQWTYWSKNGWNGFGPEAGFSDETRDLVGSGLIRFILPVDMEKGNSTLNPDLYWLRAEIDKGSAAMPKFYGIHAQAARVVFENNENDLTHLDLGLPAESLADIPREIAKGKSLVTHILQPYASFGGKMPEPNSVLYKRSAERFSHKGQAVTMRDYERLVLDNFPGIHRVKCLNHTARDLSSAAGEVTLVVIPELDNPLAINPYTPAAGHDLLRRIRDFLQSRISPFVTLHLRNAIYEPIKVEAEVAFTKGIDRYYARKELQEGLKLLLSPWAFGEKTILIGNTLHRSQICGFFEESATVDYLDMEKLVIKRGVGDGEEVLTGNKFSGNTIASVLYSSPTHQISPISTQGGS